MDYEEKMKILANCKPEKKDMILLRILRGEKGIDITQDEDIFFQVNKDRMSMEQYVNRDKFIADAKFMHEYKRDLHDTTHARTKSKAMRELGQIPAEIYYARKELSDPMIPRHERLKNIKKFLNDFPAFRTGDKRL